MSIAGREDGLIVGLMFAPKFLEEFSFVAMFTAPSVPNLVGGHMPVGVFLVPFLSGVLPRLLPPTSCSEVGDVFGRVLATRFRWWRTLIQRFEPVNSFDPQCH